MLLDPRFDDYIGKSADFARPVLEKIRTLVHAACPDAAEVMKWSFPHFTYKGSILCSMASFKQHCTFGFWLGSKMSDPYKLLTPVGERTSMGDFGKIKSMDDLPTDHILVEYIHEAMQLIEAGEKLERPAPVKKELEIPGYFIEALRKNPKALTTFENFSYSHKKEYVEWISGAKTEATRLRRLDKAIEMMEEGKSQNWKYERK